jgi:hypothetical protein
MADAKGKKQSSGPLLWSDSWRQDQKKVSVSQGSAHKITWSQGVQTSPPQGEKESSSQEEVNMSEVTEEKGAGRGRGKWTAKGVQAGVNADVEAMKVLIADMAARLDALEAGEEVPLDPEEPLPEPPEEVPVEEG